jgi:hypothetical protein
VSCRVRVSCPCHSPSPRGVLCNLQFVCLIVCSILFQRHGFSSIALLLLSCLASYCIVTATMNITNTTVLDGVSVDTSGYLNALQVCASILTMFLVGAFWKFVGVTGPTKVSLYLFCDSELNFPQRLCFWRSMHSCLMWVFLLLHFKVETVLIVIQFAPSFLIQKGWRLRNLVCCLGVTSPCSSVCVRVSLFCKCALLVFGGV